MDVGVKNAYVNYDNAKKVLLIEEENILLAKENLNITLETFKRGATTFIELRTAQQSLARCLQSFDQCAISRQASRNGTASFEWHLVAIELFSQQQIYPVFSVMYS